MGFDWAHHDEWETVVLYLWANLLSEQKSPLAGLRESLLSGETPETKALKEVPWFPELQVAGMAPRNLAELTCLFKWKKVQARIQWILEYWLKNPLPLEVVDEVVTPYHMLKEQSLGRRLITLPFKHKNLETDVVPGKKPFAFVLHDLEHAERFFHNQTNYLGQVGFYQHLHSSVECGFWEPFLQHSEFQKSFFYLMSDMNTHCVHMLKYLRANLWSSFRDAEDIWQTFLGKVLVETSLNNHFAALNTEDEKTHHLVEIEKYFVEYGRHIAHKFEAQETF